MASKQNQLVQTLLDQNQQLNATQLANSLGVSVRTVHNYINAVNAQYQVLLCKKIEKTLILK